MSDVIDIKTKRPYIPKPGDSKLSPSKTTVNVWTCGDGCASQTFFLYVDGRVLCAKCDHFITRVRCYDTKPPPPETA